MIDGQIEALRSVRSAAQELLLACLVAAPKMTVQLHRAFDRELASPDVLERALLAMIDARDASRH